MNEIEIDLMDDDLRALERTVGSTRAVVDAFESDMRTMGATVANTGREVSGLSRGLSRDLKKSFDGLMFDGMKLGDALKGVAQSMVDATYNAAINPVATGVSGALASGAGSLFSEMNLFANGGAFTQGRVIPFAKGGVVSQATNFPMRGGTGLMGEAGPEAIMPLSRGADGKLGVQAGGARSVQVTMNISTPDTEGFRRSQTQIAAQMNRALARGQRNR